MERWRTHTLLPLVLDALGLTGTDPATRRLAEAFGGEPAAVRERLVGEPARRSRRLLFASGGEIVLHDDAVAAVVLHLGPTPHAPRGLDLAEWIDGADGDATLEQLVTAVGAPRHFAGFGTPYLTLDGGYARLDFRDRRGWNEPGNLLSITVTAEEPGRTTRPEDDDCPSCSDLLVRREPAGGVDVEATVDALAAALAVGPLTEDAHWVRLADLQPLHASGLMERVESQLTCTTCRRIICLTLFRDSPPTFRYAVLDEAMRRPLEPIPPVEQWGDAARIAEEAGSMHHVDHEPGAWFLLEQQGVLYLHARYVINTMLDDSALIRLDDTEHEAYRTGGRSYISRLARRIHDGSPHEKSSPFHQRNLLRGPDARSYRDAVAQAVVNHTWLAEQRRR
ncbi:hypothetical protein GC722_09555 [Auraticoccus sp. F435]|uniref:Uncharacterized protein n=1 Tax=Auraticoccus cholistanensis TaxID=2656650 RepID=A0A6A9V0U6_9ACTN|nr:hypothetical protein [Auraticoccus cholistanensis]MVA76269.1 hypothetical protein [Auraticoccus cholistanensis]